MYACLKYIKCKSLSIKYHYPYVTYPPLELQIYHLDARTTQQQFQSQYNYLNYYKLNNIAINESFRYMNVQTWLEST